MANQIDDREQSDILKQVRSRAGRLGGKAGRGKAKRRSKAHYKRMNEIRWGKQNE